MQPDFGAHGDPTYQDFNGMEPGLGGQVEESYPQPEAAPEPATESYFEPPFEPAAQPEPEPEPAFEPAAPAPAASAVDDGGDEEGARLIALNMALNGTPREETERYLADNFELADTEALLDDVYARAGQ